MLLEKFRCPYILLYRNDEFIQTIEDFLFWKSPTHFQLENIITVSLWMTGLIDGSSRLMQVILKTWREIVKRSEIVNVNIMILRNESPH
jgi:hypothetical protein